MNGELKVCGIMVQVTHEVLLSSLKKIDYEVTETGRDNTGRKISCVVNISNTYNVNIYNVYVPNLGNDNKICINESISMNPADKNIVLGDFSCTLLKSLDRKPIPNRDDIGSTELKKYIERNDLIDVWRARNPNSKCYTFGRVNSHSHIHFIFISSELNFALQKIKFIHFPFSDHDGVIMTLKVGEPERGPGLLKMNYTVIQTYLFKHIFESFWNKWKLQKNNFKNKLEWWEQTKIKIKSLTIDASKKLNITETKLKISDNKNEISELRGNIKGYYEKKQKPLEFDQK
jgi:hypothetical protein